MARIPQCRHLNVIVIRRREGVGRCEVCGATMDMESAPASAFGGRTYWVPKLVRGAGHPANDPRYVETRRGWWDWRPVPQPGRPRSA